MTVITIARPMPGIAPSTATPARMHNVPDTTAIMPARATARSGSPPDSGRTTARMS